MSQQGDSHKRQEDDWWRQLYDEEAGAGTSSAAARDSIDEHFDSALTAMNRRPAPPSAADTLRLRRPTPPPPPPSWPGPRREPEESGERSPARGEQAPGPRAAEPPPWDAWAARPMFPTEEPGGWAEPPPAAQPWSPPSVAPSDAAPLPAKPWTSPGALEDPAEDTPGGRKDSAPPRPPEPRGPEPAKPAEPAPYAPGRSGPPPGREPAPDAEDAPHDAEPDAEERGPYASPVAWPPVSRMPGPATGGTPPPASPPDPEPSEAASPDQAPPGPNPYASPEAPGEGVREGLLPESGRFGSSGVWPPVGRGSEASVAGAGEVGEGSAPDPGPGPLGPSPYAPSSGWPPVGRASEVTEADGGEPVPGAGETAFAEGGVRWAPELPPGWVAAEGEGEPAAAVVGGGPPTYAAEPTAWPEADPDRLDGLVPDTVLDGAQYGPFTLRTASVRGDSARYRGQPRRDAVLTARFGTGDDALLLVATATGARAADDAHRAARDAVHWIAGAVGRSRERLAGDLRASRRASLKSGLHRLTDRCYGRLRARGEDLGLEEGEYTASLRCLLLPADPECRIRLFFGVGAGGLFRIRSGAWQDLDIAPDDAAAPFRFRATLAQPGDALLMCSAGLAEPLRGEPALAARLAERWGEGRVPGLAGYLADVQTRVKGYADDRTAVTVWDA